MRYEFLYYYMERSSTLMNDFQKRVGVGERQHVYGRHVGKTKSTLIPREDNGKLAGKQTEHWNGSVDCTVYPETKELRLNTKEGRVEPNE